MNNRISVSMLIGGEIHRSDIEQLAEAAHEDGAGQNYQGADIKDLMLMIEVAAQTREPVLFTAADTFSDAFDTLEATCRQLNLPYALHTQPCVGGRGEQVDYWHPDMADIVVFTYACNGDGNPMLDYKQIRRLLNAATLERELEIMERIHRFPYRIIINKD